VVPSPSKSYILYYCRNVLITALMNVHYHKIVLVPFLC
jgi:hypothetical protein